MSMQLQTVYGTWYLIEHSSGETSIVDGEGFDFGLENGETVDIDAHGVDLDTWDEYYGSLRDYLQQPTTECTDIQSIERTDCWGARYSMPGYMDATDWVLGETEEEASSDCRDIYGWDDEDDEEEELTPNEGDLVTKDFVTFKLMRMRGDETVVVVPTTADGDAWTHLVGDWRRKTGHVGCVWCECQSGWKLLEI